MRRKIEATKEAKERAKLAFPFFLDEEPKLFLVGPKESEKISRDVIETMRDAEEVAPEFERPLVFSLAVASNRAARKELGVFFIEDPEDGELLSVRLEDGSEVEKEEFFRFVSETLGVEEGEIE